MAAAAAAVTRSRSTKKLHSAICVLSTGHQLGRRKRGELIWMK